MNLGYAQHVGGGGCGLFLCRTPGFETHAAVVVFGIDVGCAIACCVDIWVRGLHVFVAGDAVLDGEARFGGEGDIGGCTYPCNDRVGWQHAAVCEMHFSGCEV